MKYLTKIRLRFFAILILTRTFSLKRLQKLKTSALVILLRLRSYFREKKDIEEWSLPDEIGSLENLIFILSRSEKRLDDTLSTQELITTRSGVIVSVVTTIAIAASGYIVDKWQSWHAINPKVIVAASTMAYAYLCIIYLLKDNVFPSKYFAAGTKPEKIAVKELMSDINYLKHMYMLEIEDCYKRINHNDDLNTKRWKKYRRAVVALVIMPLLGAIEYFIIDYFSK